MDISGRRRNAKLTQYQLAAALNVSRSAIAKWECGKVFPAAKMLPKIAAILHCSIDDLFTDAEKASAQTLLDAQQIESQQSDDTPPWEGPERDLDGVLE